jgi:putative toxin-antitoxin system antitoxin component (TIGR02293 family)
MATESALPVVSEFPPLGSYELIRTVEEGLPLDSLEKLKVRGLTSTEISQLVIPARTLKHRKARGERLSAEETERFLRVIRVLELGERIFGKREKLLSWLRGPDFEIPGRTSMSLLETEAGVQAVTGQLWAVAEGIYQ